MIDIHDHILPGIDDGSKDMEESIHLLKEAKLAGFDKVVFTPHYKENFYQVEVREKEELFEKLKEEANKLGLNIDLYLANEIYMSGDNIIGLLENEKASTINNTNYVLFELPLHSKPMNIFDRIDVLRRNKLVPILAHPERYFYMQEKPDIIFDLIENGVFMQQNFASINGQYGKKAQILAINMLKTNSVHFFGSDVHKKNTIYSVIPKCMKKIEKIIGEEKLKELTQTNPELVLNNKKIEIYTPAKINYNFIEKIQIMSK